VDAVLFDWDGTLADSHAALFAANVAVMEALGLPFDEAQYRRHYSPDWRLLYRRLGIPADRMDEAARIWSDAFAHGEPPALLPGAREALAALRDAGMPTAIVTSGQRSFVAPQLERTGIAPLVQVCVFGDDGHPQKPDPAPLLAALDALGLAERGDPDVAYLGDAPEDMWMAVAAGVRAIGVVSAFSEAGQLRAAGAEVVVPSVAAWVNSLLGSAAPSPRGRHAAAESVGRTASGHG